MINDIFQGLHLLARPVLATVTTIVVGYVATHSPELPLNELMELLKYVVSVPFGYILIKGTGNTIIKKDKNPVTNADFE